MTILWTPQNVTVVGTEVEVFQSNVLLKLVWPDLVWLLLTVGHYSEVAVNTGLTVLILRGYATRGVGLSPEKNLSLHHFPPTGNFFRKLENLAKKA